MKSFRNFLENYDPYLDKTQTPDTRFEDSIEGAIHRYKTDMSHDTRWEYAHESFYSTMDEIAKLPHTPEQRLNILMKHMPHVPEIGSHSMFTDEEVDTAGVLTTMQPNLVKNKRDALIRIMKERSKKEE